MTRVLVDEALLSKLHGLAQPLELVDGKGNVLAQVTPVAYRKLPGEPDWDEEDLRRREASPGRRYTTAEVLEHLRNLEKH
jgi:hypothetical protein